MILRRLALLLPLALGACDWLPRITLVSDAQVERSGLEAWEALRQSAQPSRDAALQAELDRIAARLLLAAGERPEDWEAVVFAGGDPNAFALPGNKIGVFEGMFAVAGGPDELAAVVGHEIGHLEAEHAQARISAELVKSLGLRLVAFLLNQGDVQFANEIAAALGLGAEYGLVLPYSRRQELEADARGLELMAAAGYDPAAAVDLWRRMEEAGAGRLPGFLSTHPTPDARIEAIEAMLPAVRAGAPLSPSPR
jgi:predicted Zn-dependent protease